MKLRIYRWVYVDTITVEMFDDGIAGEDYACKSTTDLTGHSPATTVFKGAEQLCFIYTMQPIPALADNLVGELMEPDNSDITREQMEAIYHGL